MSLLNFFASIGASTICMKQFHRDWLECSWCLIELTHIISLFYLWREKTTVNQVIAYTITIYREDCFDLLLNRSVWIVNCCLGNLMALTPSQLFIWEDLKQLWFPVLKTKIKIQNKVITTLLLETWPSYNLHFFTELVFLCALVFAVYITVIPFLLSATWFRQLWKEKQLKQVTCL